MRLGYTVRASGNMLRHPLRGIERIRGRIDRRQDQMELAAIGTPQGEVYGVVDDWQPLLHAAINAPWPCQDIESFDKVWDDAISDLIAAGLRTGIASYGGWNDGDRAQAEALWCLVAHTRPETVVETGVAHGLTTRVILEGLQRHGAGHLWSVDLPAVDPALHSEIAMAVRKDLRERWTYVPGTSRERLPGVVHRSGRLDLFVHDSLHTARNLCFELDTAWPMLRAGGVAVVDDIDHSLGFRAFVDRVVPGTSIAARHVTGNGLWGIAIKAAARSDVPARSGTPD
jgi:predicted O-methyltransferase YrrM